MTLEDFGSGFTDAAPLVTKGSVLQMPDLAVEIRSADDTVREIREKAVYDLRSRARLIWLTYPQTRTVEVGTLNLDGGTALPGFTLPLSEIFGL